jgi:hypothetical protein
LNPSFIHHSLYFSPKIIEELQSGRKFVRSAHIVLVAMPVIVSSGCLHIFPASAIGRVRVVESNERLAIRRPENQRVTYAMGALGRYIGSPHCELDDITLGSLVAGPVKREQQL